MSDVKAVAIPSGRGIRSGSTEMHILPEQQQGRNPLWSGHSFRLKVPQLYGFVIQSRNPLWSGHSFRLIMKTSTSTSKTRSQSPLVGAFVPAKKWQMVAARGILCRNPLWSGHSFRPNR